MSVIALSVAAVLSAAAQDPTGLPADLPVLEGARLALDCGEMREQVAGTMQCVTAPSERLNDLARAYVNEAKQRGWKDAGGAAIALYLVRPNDAGGCELLTVASFWDFKKHPEYRPGLTGYVGFSVAPTPNC